VHKEMTEGMKTLAIQLLGPYANQISADILLREETVDFLSWWDRGGGTHPDLQGFTKLQWIAFMGVTEVAIAMVGMKRWDLNWGDSNGATPLICAAKHGDRALAKGAS